MDEIVKNIIKKIEKIKKDCSFELISLDNQLIIFANKGSVEDIKDDLNNELSKYDKMIKTINIATAHIVPKAS